MLSRGGRGSLLSLVTGPTQTHKAPILKNRSYVSNGENDDGIPVLYDPVYRSESLWWNGI